MAWDNAVVVWLLDRRASEELRLLREQHEAHIRAYRELVEESREFTREMILRMQRQGIAQVRALDDMRDEIRANTRAVLSVLDRLEPGEASV